MAVAAHQLMILFFPLTMAFAAALDLLTMKIPNRLSAAVALGYFVLALVAGRPLFEIGQHVLCGAAMLVFTFALFNFGWIGGGDAKLAAATALWFGFDYLLDYLVYASLFGGVLTLVLIQFRRLPLPGPLARQTWILRLHETGGGVPYGIALAAAALAVYPKTGWMPAFGI